MRVLIVKTSALGDILHVLPALDYLHQVAPGIEVDWVVEEPFRELLEGNPLLSALHLVRTRNWRRHPFARGTWREISALKKTLAMRNYDMVFDVQGNLKSGLISWLTGARERFGFSGDVVREKTNLLFTRHRVPMQPLDYHVTEKYLRIISAPFDRDFSSMGLAATIATSPKDDAGADLLFSTLPGRPVFLFHCGTSWQTKLWAQKRWIELGQGILERFPGASILLTWGDQAERERCQRIAGDIGAGARVLERYPLKALAALLKRVDLVVAGDTGPVHLAAAGGTPTVSLYRATDGKLTGPRGSGHITVQSPMPCTRCKLRECDRDGACSESITVPEVLGAVDALLAPGSVSTRSGGEIPTSRP